MDYYNIGLTGTYEEICNVMHKECDDHNDTIRGLYDRQVIMGNRKDRRDHDDLLMELADKLSMYDIGYIGNMPLINIVNCEYSDIMAGACKGNHVDIVELMIQKKGLDLDWNWGLGNACISDNLYLIKLMITKGASHYDWGLICAASYGNLNAIKYMLTFEILLLDYAIKQSCDNKHWEITKYLMNIGTNFVTREYKGYYEYLAGIKSDKLSKMSKFRPSIRSELSDQLCSIVFNYT